jgi:serine/threonine-protein kinase
MAIFLLAATGLAQQPAGAEAKAAAEALFEEGRALRRAGKCTQAIPKFEQSLALDVGVGTLLRLADCYEQVGRFASAWANFRHAGSLARERRDARRADIAEDRAAALEPKLTRLAIVFGDNADIPGFVVRLGEVELEASADSVPLPVDPGTHQIVASAPGYRTLREKVTLVAGDAEQVIELPPLRKEEAAAAEPTPSPDPEDQVVERVERRYGQRIAALVMGAGSVVTGAVAAALLGVAAAKDSEADLHCDGLVCRDLEGEELSHDALELANLATAGFVVAGAAGAGALILMLTAPAYETVIVTPTASPESAGVQVKVRW